MSTSHFSIKEHKLAGQYVREYPGALLDNQEDTLQLHIKQYTPLDKSNRRPGAVTIIGAHANGFPKELYEPLWDDLYEALKQQGQAIAVIWIADVAHEGMSGVLNENKLGNDPSWMDHPRDLLHMINHFRKDMPRPLVGIGHSIGGNHLVNLSNMHPRLFSSLVLIDPVIHTARQSYPTTDGDAVSSSVAQNSTFRRDKWPSKADAMSSLKRNPFYQTWDPRVLDLWIRHGLRKLPTPLYPGDSSDDSDSEADDTPVTLTTTKHQEVFTFLRPKFGADGKLHVTRLTHPDLDLSIKEDFPFYRPEPARTFNNLQHLRPGALYVFGGESELSIPEWRKAKMERTGIGLGGSGGAKEGRVKEVVFEKVGHLIPMIATKDCAKAASEWLAEDLERYREEEAEWKSEWESKNRMQKTTVSKEWERNIGGNPRGKSTQKL